MPTTITTVVSYSLARKGVKPVLGTDYYQPATFDITNTGVTFNKNAAGTVTPASVTLSTAFANITGTVSYQWQKNGSNISGATSSTYAVPKADFDSVTSNTYSCTISGSINGSAGTRTDSITIPLLQDGSSAIQVLNSNENISFAADTTGQANISFTNGGSVITAYIGTNQLIYSATAVANSFSATLAATGATVAVGTGSGNTFTVPAPTAMTGDTAYTTVTVIVRDAANVPKTITTVVSYSLSRKGIKGDTGANGISAILSNETHTFPATNAGAVSSYVGSGTTIRIYEGANELTYSTAATTPSSAWKVTSAVGTNITAGTIAAVASTVYARMPDLTTGVATAVDTSSIVYTITGKNAAGIEFTITKTQTFSKAKQGDKPVAGTDYTVTNGTSPLIYDIITSAPVITKESPDAATTGTYSSITIQGRKYDGNVTTNYGWVTVTANGNTEAASAIDTAASAYTLTPPAASGKSFYTIKMYSQATVSGATLLDTQIVNVVFKGQKGADSTVKGDTGARGSNTAYKSGYTAWDGAVATAYFTDTYGSVVLNDTITLYGTNFSQTRFWNGSAWVQVTVAIDGNLLVTGTVGANKISTATALIGHQIRNASGTFVMDFGTNPYISISV